MSPVRLLFGALALTVIAAACGSGAVSETAPTTGPAPGVMSPAGLGSALATTPTTTSAAAFTPAASPVTSTPAASVVTGAVTSTTPAGRGLPRLQVADRLPDEGGAQQLVVVEVADSTDTFAQVQAFDRVDGQWQPAFAPTTARIGRSGISANHHEGDGTTPQGV